MFLLDKKLKNFSFRNYKNLKTWYFNNKRFKNLSLGLRGNSGRDSLGRIVVHSKGSVKSKIVFNILSTTFRGFFFLASLVQIKFDIKRSGNIGLFSNSMGCWFYSLLPTNFFLFDYIKVFNKGISNMNSISVVTNYWPRFIYDIAPHSRICSIEIILNNNITKKIKYIRSAGSRGLLLDNKYKDTLSIIILPSLKVKILSNSSIAFLNNIHNELHKYQNVKKAGFYKNKGIKPTVRGIVKNPCDHPNGGRTRTILLSRTPWGKVAKKSRKQNVIKNLKVLSKRITKAKNVNKSFFSVNLFQNNKTVNYISKIVMDNLSNN